jgi:DNA-binding MarR family transcriptional regulator
MSAADRDAAAPARSTAHEVFASLVRAQTRLWNAVDALVRARHGLPLTQLTALQVVEATEECKVGDLVRTLHITVGGASKVVDRLVAAGLVERVPNARDRRSPALATTAQGSDLLRTAAPTYDEVLHAELVDRVSDDDLTSLHRILADLATVSGPDAGAGR